MNKLSIKITFNSKYIWNVCNAKFLMCLHKAKRIQFIEKLPQLWMFLPFNFCLQFRFLMVKPGIKVSQILLPLPLIAPISVLYLCRKSAKRQSASIGEAFRDAKFVLICLWKPSTSFVPLRVWYLFNPCLSVPRWTDIGMFGGSEIQPFWISMTPTGVPDSYWTGLGLRQISCWLITIQILYPSPSGVLVNSYWNDPKSQGIADS